MKWPKDFTYYAVRRSINFQRCMHFSAVGSRWCIIRGREGVAEVACACVLVYVAVRRIRGAKLHKAGRDKVVSRESTTYQCQKV